ncbi:uncharacterized protein LOC134209837 [Armigeres subalbatus]|uniref:uncharacterized protein LOC134209837 n=1 Tax=Armigeres subalbatus TaxID=124917 RepID=UPI002ED5FF8A
MATFNFSITPFVENDVGPTSSRWDMWKDQFSAYLALKNVCDHEEMFRALMCFGGPDVRKIAQNVSLPDGNIMDNRYRLAMDALDGYYAPRMSLRYERFKFRQMKFDPHEKLDHFVIRLRSQAALCNFDEQLEQMLMDQIVFATQNDDKLRAKYLEVDVCLDDMLKIGRTHYSVKAQVQELRGKTDDVGDLNVMDTANQTADKQVRTCFRCLGNHFAKDPGCPARSSRCNKCKSKGHFARCCDRFQKFFKQRPRFTNTRKQETGENIRRFDKKPKFIHEIEDVTKPVEIRELFHLNGKRLIQATVGGAALQFVVDTGADEDVLSEADWNTLKQVGFEAFGARRGSNKVFNAYGSNKPLQVLGEVDVKIQIDGSSCYTTFYVIKGGKCSLLSGSSAEKLGVVKFLRTLSADTLPVIKDFCASIKIDRAVPPVQQSYRRIPVSLEELALLKLKELEKQDVIERVQGASEWVSPMIVKRKSANEVRIIIDLREANKAIIRRFIRFQLWNKWFADCVEVKFSLNWT